MQEQKELHCKNCNSKLRGEFCADCGQNARVSNLTFKSFLVELSESVFQIDRGFLFTIKELCIRPGHAIRDFIQGKRKNYFKPVTYAFTLSTLYFLITRVIEINAPIEDLLVGWEGGRNINADKNSSSETYRWITDNYPYVILLSIPFYAVASKLAFLEKGFNYLEHLVLNCFVTGQQALIYPTATIPSLLVKDAAFLESIPVIFALFFSFYTFVQFFDSLKIWEAIVRVFLSYVIIFIFIIIALLSITIISNSSI